MKVEVVTPLALKGKTDLPLMLEIHGGGGIVLDYVCSKGVSCRMAVDQECIVANVNFRNAPEAPIPKAFEDAIAAIKYFHENADKYGIDKDYISI